MLQTLSDLKSSGLGKRPYKLSFSGAVDLRDDPGHGEHVRLVGGPYDGRRAVVDKMATYAWVAGDYFYRKQGDSWVWWYDAFS